jgi:caffeoyl-CoA O-methyltransferase
MKLVSEEIENYCRSHTTPLSAVFDRLREATFAQLQAPQMQVGLLEGRFLAMLVALSGAKRVLEFGTFSGFSSLAMAEALPDDGELITCDLDPKATTLAQEFWSQSPHGRKIQLKLGRAQETLSSLNGPFDLVFVDADKAGYQEYWERSIPLLRPGGLMVVDNVLWSGRVLNPQEKSDREIHAFNEHARQDQRMEIVMLPVRDGMLLARKR